MASTIGDLFKAKEITEEQLVDVVAAYVAKSIEGEREIGPATLDVASAVNAHPYAKATMADDKASMPEKRMAVRTAILLATPNKQ